MEKIKLTVEYDGTDFSGWQIQPENRTVQGEIEKVLYHMLKYPVRITGSGRTDAGVHALGQVAHFETSADLEGGIYKKALNTLLPKDIRILQSEIIQPEFHARFDAIRRTYRYHIAKKQGAIGRQYSWYPEKFSGYNIELMKTASACLIGEHDFTSFARNGDATGSYKSIVYDINWYENQKEHIFEISAIRFFHNMIRIVIGTLIEVGCEKLSLNSFKDLLEIKDRTMAGMTAPPHGLYLAKVAY